MQIYDISPLISEKIAVFPGDQPFEHIRSLSMEKGDHLDLSSIKCTLHLGSHADAPSHYGPAESIDKVALVRYIGLAQLIHVSLQPNERLLPQHISKVQIAAPRVLFRTDSFPDPDVWNNDFNSLSPELIQYLHDKGVKLVGIDTPSVDPADSKKLESHKEILRLRLSILEGLMLNKVPEDLYQLIALPLKIKGAEASPVRAILLPKDELLSSH